LLYLPAITIKTKNKTRETLPRTQKIEHCMTLIYSA